MSAEGRVENQKLNQTADLLSFGWVFGFQLDLLENKYPIKQEKPCKFKIFEGAGMFQNIQDRSEMVFC